MNDKHPHRVKRHVPPGYQVRKKLGRDEDEGVVRIQLNFTLEEWDEIEDRASGKGQYPRAWLLEVIREELG